MDEIPETYIDLGFESPEHSRNRRTYARLSEDWMFAYHSGQKRLRTIGVKALLRGSLHCGDIIPVNETLDDRLEILDQCLLGWKYLTTYSDSKTYPTNSFNLPRRRRSGELWERTVRLPVLVTTCAIVRAASAPWDDRKTEKTEAMTVEIRDWLKISWEKRLQPWGKNLLRTCQWRTRDFYISFN